MSTTLKTFYLLIAVSTPIHWISLITINKWRIFKLRRFIDDFKDRGVLSKSDYDLLYDRYHGFFNYLEFFPDRDDFPALYEDQGFNRFVTKTRSRLKYFLIGGIICIILIAIFVPSGGVRIEF